MSDFLDYEAVAREIQNIVRGACLDPAIRKKAAAAGKAPHVFDSRLGGHWAGRIIAVMLDDEPLYRVDRTHRRKRTTDPVKYVQVWPTEDNDE